MTINYNYQINSTNYNPATTTFYWRVVSRAADVTGTEGVVLDDFDTSSGSKLSDGNITTITVGVKEQTGTQGTRNFTLQVSTFADFSSNVVTKDFQVTDGAAASDSLTLTGSTAITEPPPGVVRPYQYNQLSNGTTQNLTSIYDMHYLDKAEVAIYAAINESLSIPASSNPGYTRVQQWADPQTNWQSSLSTNLAGYIVSFEKANTSGSITVTESTSGFTETHNYTLDTAGEYTYTIASTYLSTTLYWQAEAATGGSTSNWVTGYTTGAGTTSASGNNLRGTVTTDGSGNATFKVRLNASQSTHTFNLKVYTDSGYSTEVSNPTYPGTISVSLPAVSYSISTTGETLPEDELTSRGVFIDTSGVATDLSVGVPLRVSGTGITASELQVATQPSPLTFYQVTQLDPLEASTIGAVKAYIGPTGIGQVSFRANADTTSEGNETMTITMATNADNGDATGGGSANMTIADTSLGTTGIIYVDNVPLTSGNSFSANVYGYGISTGVETDFTVGLAITVFDDGVDTTVYMGYRKFGTNQGTDPGSIQDFSYKQEGTTTSSNLTQFTTSNDGIIAWVLFGKTGLNVKYALSASNSAWNNRIDTSNTLGGITGYSDLTTSYTTLSSGNGKNVFFSDFLQSNGENTSDSFSASTNFTLYFDTGSVEYAVTWDIQVGGQAERGPDI